MTETMKKFKPPFVGEDGFVVENSGRVVCEMFGADQDDRNERAHALAEIMSAYYANKREQSERKGEKE